MGHFPDFICRMKPMAYAKKVMLRVLTRFPTARPSTNSFVIPNRAGGPVRNLLSFWIGTARGSRWCHPERSASVRSGTTSGDFVRNFAQGPCVTVDTANFRLKLQTPCHSERG
jgi:hypothetical protein